MSITNKNKAQVNLRNRVEIAEGNKTQKDAKFNSTFINTVDGSVDARQPGNFHRPKDRTPEMQTATDRVRAYLANPETTDEFMEGFNNPQFDKA